MRSDYSVIKQENSFAVHEAQTDQIIREFATDPEAQKFRKFLARGGGFNGYTPSFILNVEHRKQMYIEPVVDVNELFEQVVFTVQHE